MTPNNVALLIGIEDYSLWDRSEGRAPGASDVPGAVNDARVWFRQCIRWGFSPENIRVHTAPVLRASDLGPEAIPHNVRDASAAALQDSLAWLASRLSSAEPCAGLMTFSGHGEQGRGILLCPSDMTAADQRLIHLAEVRGLVGGPRSGSLTIIVDACRDAAGPKPRVAVRQRLRGWGRRMRGFVRSGPGDARALAACEPNGTAVSAEFGGVTLGAFTWALTSALGQWRAVQDRGVVRLDASYGELLHRTRVLLRALSFDQIPTLMGAPLIDSLPFLEPEGRRVRGCTQTEPSGRRKHRQLDPSELDFRVYELRYLDASQVDLPLAQIIVTSAAGAVETTAGTFELGADEEYWFVASDTLSRIASGTGGSLTLHVEGDYNYAPEGGERAWTGDVRAYHLIQTTPAPTTWRAGSSAWPSGAVVFESGSDAIAFALSTEVDPQAGSTGLARFEWYQTGNDPLFHGNAAARYVLARRAGTSPFNARYNRAVSEFDLFADLA